MFGFLIFVYFFSPKKHIVSNMSGFDWQYQLSGFGRVKRFEDI